MKIFTTPKIATTRKHAAGFLGPHGQSQHNTVLVKCKRV